jgi:hypothetical protein
MGAARDVCEPCLSAGLLLRIEQDCKSFQAEVQAAVNQPMSIDQRQALCDVLHESLRQSLGYIRYAEALVLSPAASANRERLVRLLRHKNVFICQTLGRLY